jgi:hypothetical protein
MAVDDVILDTVTVVGAKVETTTGTAITVAAAEADMIVLNCEITPDHNVSADREGVNNDGTEQAIPGGQTGRCTLELEISGNGASGLPQWAGTFLPACGWEDSAGTLTYAPTSATTITICKWTDGIKQTLSGARGSFSITMRPGVPARIRFEFIGNYADEAADANPTPSVPTVLAPIWVSGTCTLASYAMRLSELGITSGNQVFLRPDPAAASGYRSAWVGGKRVSTFTADPEMEVLATKDWHQVQKAGTEGAMSVVLGSAANNTITITGARAQVLQAPRGRRDALATRQLSGQFNGASPFTIAFS